MEDFRLHDDYVDSPAERPRRSTGWLIAAAIVLTLGAAAGIYVSFGRRQVQAPQTPPPPVAHEEAHRLGGQPEPIALPPLDQSDAVVRTLVHGLSAHPVVAAWLATDDLVRGFTAAVSNIADGTSPAKQLNALRPQTGFTVVEKDGKYFIDPRSYDRYRAVADAVDSVDPAGAAKLYATLKPRIDDAAGELGVPADRVDRLLERAIVALLRTPTPEGPVQVTQNVEGIGYGFADGRLEGLSPGQKALVRMGPRNARVIKTKLREIAVALGVPPGHLQ
jgi:Protein of unknown function (DUF3014)